MNYSSRRRIFLYNEDDFRFQLLVYTKLHINRETKRQYQFPAIFCLLVIQKKLVRIKFKQKTRLHCIDINAHHHKSKFVHACFMFIPCMTLTLTFSFPQYHGVYATL